MLEIDEEVLFCLNLMKLVPCFSWKRSKEDGCFQTHVLLGSTHVLFLGETNAGKVGTSSNMFQLYLSKLPPGYLNYDYTMTCNRHCP